MQQLSGHYATLAAVDLNDTSGCLQI